MRFSGRTCSLQSGFARRYIGLWIRAAGGHAGDLHVVLVPSAGPGRRRDGYDDDQPRIRTGPDVEFQLGMVPAGSVRLGRKTGPLGAHQVDGVALDGRLVLYLCRRSGQCAGQW